MYSDANTNIAPVAKISATPLTGASPLQVTFSSEGSYDENNDALTYTWETGTGKTFFGPILVYTYPTDGNYTATLTINDGRGSTDTKEIVIRVGTSNTNNIIPSHVKTVVNPVPTYIGGDAIITTTIANRGAANPMIVDMEVYNEQGIKVAQKIFEDVTIPANGTKDFTFTWFPDNIGNYRVTIGLFQQNWVGMYEWTNEALNFAVIRRAPGGGTDNVPFKLNLEGVAVNPIPAHVGELVTVSTGVRNSGDVGSGLVDIEVYKDGVQIGQQFTDAMLFAKNELQHVVYTFSPKEAGHYKVSVGLFKPHWQGMFSWNQDVFDITVVAPIVVDPSPSVVVFENNLAQGWDNWSWDTDVWMNDKINVNFKSAWAGLFLHTNGFSTLGKNTLHFEISNQANDDQKMQILMYGESGKVIATKQLSGNHAYDIPLTELDAANKLITGFAIQGQTGITPQPFSIDNIKFY